MIYRDDAMAKVVKLAQQIAGSDASVLITGESGTGKEVLARYVHARSQRAKKPFITVNCAAIPENLLESELFGHEKGAFTGALGRRIGKFEEANGGTLLLDEISEMDVRLQAKLLRAIQERVIDRVGGGRPVPVDIRIIATSNRNLTEAVREGKFREDLLFRLNVVNLKIPPLRERPADIAELAAIFRQEIFRRPTACRCARCRRKRAARSSINRWPGNVRELENTLHRAVLLSTGVEIGVDGILTPDGARLDQARGTGAAAQAAIAAEQVTRTWSAAPWPRSSATYPGDAQALPRQPHACRQYPRHLDPHAAQQAQRIRRRRRADPAAEWRRGAERRGVAHPQIKREKQKARRKRRAFFFRQRNGTRLGFWCFAGAAGSGFFFVPGGVELDRLGHKFIADRFQALDQIAPVFRQPRAPVGGLDQDIPRS